MATERDMEGDVWTREADIQVYAWNTFHDTLTIPSRGQVLIISLVDSTDVITTQGLEVLNCHGQLLWSDEMKAAIFL